MAYSKRKKFNPKISWAVIVVSTLVLISIMYLLEVRILGYAILNPDSIGFNQENRNANYEELVSNILNNENLTSVINSSFLWVPWFTTSSKCDQDSLHQGSSCNIGTVNFTQNCMVSDEFSQVGIITALSANQTRMDQFYNTVVQIRNPDNVLASWKSYRNGSNIIACGNGVNNNCDTASDADARIMIALFTASNSSLFTNETQKQLYASLALSYAEDFVRYELVNECHDTHLGKICYWLSSGSQSKISGLSSNDFGYTGYYSDAVIAMLQACAQTRDINYCNIANNISLNYLLASSFNGSQFGVPPGKSFKWTNLTGSPTAVCTNTCSPIQWDDSDAPRALGICQALYYADLMNVNLSVLDSYCSIWRSTYLNDPTKAPYRYLSNGTSIGSPQSGYFVQGLQSLAQFSTDLYVQIIDNALSHYNPSTKKWDSTSCSGVYTTSIPIRSLGAGIGRDTASFSVNMNLSFSQNESTQNSTNSSTENNSTTNSTTNNSTGNSSSSNSSSSNIGGSGGSGSNVQIESDINSTSTNESIEEEFVSSSSEDSCKPSWECDWSSCIDDLQNATNCIDLNSCDSNLDIPTTRECNLEETTKNNKFSLGGAAISPLQVLSESKATIYKTFILQGVTASIIFMIIWLRQRRSIVKSALQEQDFYNVQYSPTPQDFS